MEVTLPKVILLVAESNVTIPEPLSPWSDPGDVESSYYRPPHSVSEVRENGLISMTLSAGSLLSM